MEPREPLAGFHAPVHRALTEPLLLGGAPRAVAMSSSAVSAMRTACPVPFWVGWKTATPWGSTTVTPPTISWVSTRPTPPAAADTATTSPGPASTARAAA